MPARSRVLHGGCMSLWEQSQCSAGSYQARSMYTTEYSVHVARRYRGSLIVRNWYDMSSSEPSQASNVTKFRMAHDLGSKANTGHHRQLAPLRMHTWKFGGRSGNTIRHTWCTNVSIYRHGRFQMQVLADTVRQSEAISGRTKSQRGICSSKTWLRALAEVTTSPASGHADTVL